MLIDAEFQCAYCGQGNPTTVDPAAGQHQSYVEDCQVCCRPNLLSIEVDTVEAEAWVEARPENE